MKKIMIVIDTSRASGRKFLTGVEKYTSAFVQWQIFIKSPDYLADNTNYPDDLIDMDHLDGILARDAINTDQILESDIPKVINDSKKELIPGVSTIVTDSYKIGKLAAIYFLDIGFKNFAYCGFNNQIWSQKRSEGFSETLNNRKINNFFEYAEDIKSPCLGSTARNKIKKWLISLPKPVCVFACNDDRAITILEACKITGLSVPDEVAVMGVDNDELICNLSSPSLSSIEINFEKTGFLAAQHLHLLIQKKAKSKVIYASPVEIITRKSTDVLTIEDDEVVNAIRFIRENHHKPIQVIDVVDITSLSQRELQRRFKKHLKKTIKQTIQEVRIELIKKMLINSNESICNIAQNIDFTNPEHLSRYFKNATGLTPLEFRRSTRVEN
jgi:LacI family transcriptional regulator